VSKEEHTLGDHPTPAELEGFVWASISSECARAVLSHLVDGCRQCRAAIARHLREQRGKAEPPEPVLTPQQSAAYDAAISRATAAVLKRAEEYLQERKREALALLMNSSLEALPEVPPHLQGVPMFEALLERSWALRHDNPQEMVRLAKWARLVADKLELGDLPLSPIQDLRCRAWIELANAYRVADELAESETTLASAIDLFSKGSHDEKLAARLFTVQGSLYGALRIFDLASTAFDLVFAIQMRHRERHLAGRALIMKGILIGYQKPEEALHLIGRGLELIEEHRDPNLVLAAAQNQARLLVEIGRFREARIALFNLKASGVDLGGRVFELKLRWVEAQINVGLGELERAEKALLEVKQGFEEAELGYKAALAALELGGVMLQRGLTDAANAEILQAVEVFEAVGVQREARASLLLLRKSCELQMVKEEVLNYVIDLLRKGETSPTRLEPPTEE
jgi:tetratricopeptide (TPR) repeat protein